MTITSTPRTGPPVRHDDVPPNKRDVIKMAGVLVTIAIIAIVLILFGGFVQAVQWLLWLGIVLLIIAVIAGLLRFLSGRRNTSV